MNAPHDAERFRLIVVSAGTSDPSSTRLLADRIASRATALAARRGNTVTVSVIELRELAADIASALTSQLITPKLEQAINTLGQADGIVASAPVYQAGPSGLFTSFFQVLDNDLLIGQPVVLAATAGTARHALVADDQMRPLFAFLRTMAAPTSVFAAPEDWSDPRQLPPPPRQPPPPASRRHNPYPSLSGYLLHAALPKLLTSSPGGGWPEPAEWRA